MGAKLYVSNYKKSSNFKQSVLQEFYKGAQLVLSYLLSHMMGKSPLSYICMCNYFIKSNFFSKQKQETTKYFNVFKVIGKACWDNGYQSKKEMRRINDI